MIALKDTNYLCNVRRSTRIVNTKKVKCFKLTTFFFGAFCISFFLFIATSCTDQDLSFYLEKITHNLSVPTNLNATATDGQVQLSWDVKADLAYYVYWSTNSGVDINNGTKIENVTSPFKHTKLTNGHMYYYIITANNGFTISPPTNEVSAMPSKTSPPTGLTAVAGDAKVTLSWNIVNGTTYTLYWSTTQGVNTANGTPIANVTSPHTHMGLMNNTAYYYVLTATNRFGVSLPSPEQSATPVRTTPQPTGLMAVAGDAQVTLSWNIVNGTTYTLYWSTTQGVNTTNGTPIANVTSPHTHMGLINGDTYYYVLTATNRFGVSLPSSEQPATPVRTTPQPTGLMATASVAQVTLSWNVVNGTTYTLYWSTTQGVNTTNGASISNVTSPYTHMSLTNETSYYYVLIATKRFSVSLPSSETSATPAQTVAIWRLGLKPGHFGFGSSGSPAVMGYGVCENERANGGTNSIGAKLRSLDYTKAVFFGSTNTYHFKNIVSDGLGLNEAGRHLLRLFKLNGNVAEDVTGASTTTIEDIVSPVNSNNGSRETIFRAIGMPSLSGSTWWTFTQSNGDLDTTKNCSGASSNGTGVTGIAGSYQNASNSSQTCNQAYNVVCVAK